MNKNISLSEVFFNTRDLGGYNTIFNKKTKYGVFIRTNMPNDIDNNDIPVLKENGIINIIDLRREKEVINKPNPLNVNDFNYINISLNDNCSGDDYHGLNINDRYLCVIERNKESIGNIINTIADLKGVIMFGCAAGKDRTGILSYLLLSIVGTTMDDIIKDYSLSKPNHIEYNERKGIYYDKNDLSEPSRILVLDKYIKDKYISIENFLYECGVTKRNLDLIKEKMI